MMAKKPAKGIGISEDVRKRQRHELRLVPRREDDRHVRRKVVRHAGEHQEEVRAQKSVRPRGVYHPICGISAP